MAYSLFWVFLKKDSADLFPNPFQELGSISIFELADDGRGFFWPEKPLISTLTPEQHSEHQDIDSYLVDGESFFAGGYYKNVYEFIHVNHFPYENIYMIELGMYSSIGAAREAWSTKKTMLL